MKKKRRRHKMSGTMQRHASLQAAHENKPDVTTHAIRLMPRHHTRPKSPRKRRSVRRNATERKAPPHHKSTRRQGHKGTRKRERTKTTHKSTTQNDDIVRKPRDATGRHHEDIVPPHFAIVRQSCCQACRAGKEKEDDAYDLRAISDNAKSDTAYASSS